MCHSGWWRQGVGRGERNVLDTLRWPLVSGFGFLRFPLQKAGPWYEGYIRCHFLCLRRSSERRKLENRKRGSQRGRRPWHRQRAEDLTRILQRSYFSLFVFTLDARHVEIQPRYTSKNSTRGTSIGSCSPRHSCAQSVVMFCTMPGFFRFCHLERDDFRKRAFYHNPLCAS